MHRMWRYQQLLLKEIMSYFPKRRACIVAVLLSATLAACGGGDSYGDAIPTEPPPAPLPVPASTYAALSLVVDNAATPGYAGETDRKIDPSLLNAWGLAFNPTGVAWVANQGSSKSTLYDGNGVVNALAPAMPTNFKPTGIVFNAAPAFKVTSGTASANSAFLFASDSGKIAGWSPAVDRNNAILAFDNSVRTGAVYKGLASVGSGTATVLLATDFFNNRIDVFDGNFQPIALAGAFQDPSLPDGYAVFGIQTIDDKVYVSYAKRDASRHEHVAGAGLGMINVFDTSGRFLKRLASPDRVLNAPWGMTKAPATFGAVAGKLLVANAGDGRINAFDIESGSLAGALSKADKTPLVIDGLWAIGFGNGAANQPLNTLYFTAGPGKQLHGAYGRIDLK